MICFSFMVLMVSEKAKNMTSILFGSMHNKTIIMDKFFCDIWNNQGYQLKPK